MTPYMLLEFTYFVLLYMSKTNKQWLELLKLKFIEFLAMQSG